MPLNARQKHIQNLSGETPDTGYTGFPQSLEYWLVKWECILLALCFWDCDVAFVYKKKIVWVHLWLLVTSRNELIEQNLCPSKPLDVDTHWAPSYPCRGHGRSDIVLLQQPSVPAGEQERGHLPDPSPDLRAPCPHLPGLCREALLEQGWGCSPPGAETRAEDWALSTGDSLSQIWAWVSYSALLRACQSLCFFISAGKALCPSWGGKKKKQ